MSESSIRERVVDKLRGGFANIEQMGMDGDEQFQAEWEQHKTNVRCTPPHAPSFSRCLSVRRNSRVRVVEQPRVQREWEHSARVTDTRRLSVLAGGAILPREPPIGPSLPNQPPRADGGVGGQVPRRIGAGRSEGF
jgi:hypothetical protein